MSFHAPQLLWLLALPLLALLGELTRRRRAARAPLPKILRAEAGLTALEIAPENSPAAATGVRVRWRLWLGVACAITALARPQYGEIETPVFDQSREILIAVDLSRSMLAEDVRPNRLDRARLLITSLLERLAGERVGLIVFAGTAFLQSPLSADYEILREFLPALGPDYLPMGGTDYTALLTTAREAFSQEGGADRFLIILSDGESQNDTWRREAEALRRDGVRVLGLGIGTAAGAMLPDGQGSFVKDERGAVVLSRLNATTLEELTRLTNGVYRDASTWVDLSALIAQTVEAGRQGEFSELNRVRLAERYQWLLAPAFLLLAWSYWREFPVHPRSRQITLAPRHPTAATATTAALLVAWAVLHFSPPLLAQATPPAQPASDPFAAPLSSLVARLATQPTLPARDYGDMAQTTLTYAQRRHETSQPTTSGTIRDGLAAVTAGEALDPTATDWAELRRKLSAFLDPEEPPPESDQDSPPQDGQGESDPNKQNESGERSPEDSKSDSNNENADQPSPSESDPEGTGDPPDSPGPDDEESPQREPPNDAARAFNDLEKTPDLAEAPAPGEAQPEPPPADTQEVGGQPNRPTPAEINPALAVPLQKLEQLRNQDSPAQLFQLMQDPTAPPPPKGRDW